MKTHDLLRAAIVILAVFTLNASALAQDEAEALRKQVEMLEKQLETVKERLEQLESKSEEQGREIATTRREARSAERADTKWHLAGYANAGFTAIDNAQDTNSFSMVQFNPMFHFQYSDKVLFEAELELATESDGSTTTEVEYSQIDYLVNDNLTLVLGKYLSPIGQFQERLHPTWINKLPNAPAGFAHGEAQPLTDVGVQARGGIQTGSGIFTYTVFAGNGPQPGHGSLELEGFGNDNNDDKAFGGRFAFLPNANLEFGISAMTADEVEPNDFHVEGNAGYDLYGVDFAYTASAWDFRGEYINSELDDLREEHEHEGLKQEDDHEDEEEELTEIVGTDWEAWYLQLARKFGQWEPVVRYGQYEVSQVAGAHDEERALFFKQVGHAEEEPFTGRERRLTLGLNYLFAPSIIAKLAWENRDFSDSHQEDEQRLMVQIAYGF